MTEKELQALKNRYSIIGNTPGLNYALTRAYQVSATDLTVLITGESGVGKEVFSQIIHNQSSRKHNPFIAINCGAIPEGTIDSELFGHEKGAFTSAVDSRKGYFETVNGGTIFLDEIGEMPLITQARLLRVLETGEFIRVGSSKVQKTSVRIIAATNRDLLDQVQINKFREDLYYRLSTVPIKVPSLRERPDDIHLLFRKFCTDFAEKYRTSPTMLTDNARQVLTRYPWPGNVRELKNMAEQISVLAKEKTVDAPELLNFLPVHKQSSNLPAIINKASDSSSPNANTDILYQLFIDLKKDVTELKNVFVGMAQGGGRVNMNDMPNYNFIPNDGNNMVGNMGANNIIINNPQDNNGDNHHPTLEVVEESLRISDKEKELIIKALGKHRNRRRDAAVELGISERTLYRKIKEYELED